MSAALERPPEEAATTAATPTPPATPDGLFPSPTTTTHAPTALDLPTTLGSLPLGARLVLRCRKDWRTASVAAFEPDLARVVLSVASPSGHTYRVRRPADSPLTIDGPIPVLGEGSWRPGLARYDKRW